jgi:hypothetical protein
LTRLQGQHNGERTVSSTSDAEKTGCLQAKWTLVLLHHENQLKKGSNFNCMGVKKENDGGDECKYDVL